jgi:hypothetical protein
MSEPPISEKTVIVVTGAANSAWRVAAGQSVVELVDRQAALAGRVAQLVGGALAFDVRGAQRRQRAQTFRRCRRLRARIAHHGDGLGSASSKRGRPSSGISAQAG